ncbi:MAG: DNA polymerase III subunit gamma and tau [Arcanobacterium sp.]|nr:DNA polymerase III subunit gamma and tau [Arcanobacterium sp.]
MALYRRYRPETFEEVIGQEHVIDPLMAALEAGRTNHAYLFSGPRGCGKTTSARILARALNCVEYPTATPCGECDSCRELARGGSGSLDVVELDAASHGGVDDARELREQVAFAPVRDRFKIFIIDEAHMVTDKGFNALLKVVEEPPEHVKFIFATTEPEKVIGTIRSRTHHYPFRLVPPSTLEQYLEEICHKEGIEAGHDVLQLIVRAGTGSVRDTLSVLDQIIGGSDGVTLDYDRTVALLGFTSARLIDSAIDAITARDGARLFGVVDDVVKSGHDPRRFVEDLLQRLRDLVIIALAGEGARDVFVAVPQDQYEVMTQQAEKLGPRRASQSADITNAALSAMVGATAPRMQLELLCARLIVANEGLSSGDERKSHRARVSTDQEDQTALSSQDMPGMSVASAPRSTSGQTAGMPASVKDRISRATAVPTPGSDAQGRGALGNEEQPRSSREAQTTQQVRNPYQAAQAQQSAQLHGERPQGSQPSQGAWLPANGRSERERSTGEMNRTEASASSDPRTRPMPAFHGEFNEAAPQLAQVAQLWETIVDRASQNSKVAGNLLANATGPASLEGDTLTIGFPNAGMANSLQRNQRAHVAVAQAVKSVLGIDVEIEGIVGAGAPDAPPKAEQPPAPVAQANTPQANVAHPDEAPPRARQTNVQSADKRHLGDARLNEELLEEIDEITAGEEEELPGYPENEPEQRARFGGEDPAGVLGCLLDDSAIFIGGDHTGASPTLAQQPFYAQDLPDLPPVDAPPLHASSAPIEGLHLPQGSREDASLEGMDDPLMSGFAESFAAMPGMPDSYPQEAPFQTRDGLPKIDRSVSHTRSSSSVSLPTEENLPSTYIESDVISEGESDSGQGGDDTDESQDVSIDDPIVDSEDIVGLGVVLKHFDGIILSETPNNADA